MPSTSDFRRTAQRVIDAVGGTGNIQSHGHCASRLRLTLKDTGKINERLLAGDKLIKGYFFSGGQYQIVIGIGLVTQAYAQLAALLDGNAAAHGHNRSFIRNILEALKSLFAPQKSHTPQDDTHNRLPAQWRQPIDGRLLPLDAVPDPAFAQGAIGIGFAIDPAGGEVRSPVDGSINAIYPSKHAIGITADNGLEILLHIGIDSVALKGEGFKLLAGVNSRVQAGQALLQVDWEHLRRHIPSIISPVIFPELDAAQWRVRIQGQTVSLESGGAHD